MSEETFTSGECAHCRQFSPALRWGFAHVETYTDLWASHLDPEHHARTCGYWYTVTTRATSHVAFAERAHLDRWLAERGLTLAGDISAEGSHCEIIGAYRRALHILPPAEFEQLDGLRTRTVDNGDYTLAIISTDRDGLRVEHVLNPNVHDRPVFDYAESRRLYG